VLNEGFLGTAAPRYADVVVLFEFGIGVALLIERGGFGTTPGASPPSCSCTKMFRVKHFGTMARNPRGPHRRY
jgi:hypothetical protein